jgi:NitT/TauT family transport system ATP-binding protein
MNDAPNATGPLVSLRGVRKAFASGTMALDGLDLAIGQHEFLSILGPSGCGKSTALRLIAGLIKPSAGAIDWPSDKLTEETGAIGFVFQEPTLMPWATVADNVRLPLVLKSAPKREADRSVAEALEMVGLAGFARAYPRELSGGMKMRVSIARAIVTQPCLLLMDEPFAALDEITRLKLNDDLLELWRAQSWTVVFVTHSMFESVYLSQRVAVMTARPGRIAREIAIDVPYPRDAAFRTSKPYNKLCREASAALHQAMAI